MKQTSRYDLSGGCQHLRDIAEESGIEWEAYHSEEETIQIGNATIDVWYDENASSPWTAWGAWIKGVGSVTASCREFAIERAFVKYRKQSRPNG